MKPLQHAHITSHRYGGQWQDWIAFHDWIDRSKAIFASMQHRMFLHSDFGQWLASEVFGEFMESSNGVQAPTVELFRDHQIEDLGRIVTLSEWLCETDAVYWKRRLQPPRYLEQIREEPTEGLARRWGGISDDYRSLIEFFDKPCQFAPDSPESAAMITHNSFGIFLAEELLGTTISLTNRNNRNDLHNLFPLAPRRKTSSTRASARFRQPEILPLIQG